MPTHTARGTSQNSKSEQMMRAECINYLAISTFSYIKSYTCSLLLTSKKIKKKRERKIKMKHAFYHSKLSLKAK